MGDGGIGDGEERVAEGASSVSPELGAGEYWKGLLMRITVNSLIERRRGGRVSRRWVVGSVAVWIGWRAWDWSVEREVATMLEPVGSLGTV